MGVADTYLAAKPTSNQPYRYVLGIAYKRLLTLNSKVQACGGNPNETKAIRQRLAGKSNGGTRNG